jgi:hypothetical protein
LAEAAKQLQKLVAFSISRERLGDPHEWVFGY